MRVSYWVSTLKKAGNASATLVEVGHATVQDPRPRSPIELVVAGRYLVRLWPGMQPTHMQDVLAVLERER
jgi:hypothetical protein